MLNYDGYLQDLWPAAVLNTECFPGTLPISKPHIHTP